MDVISVGKSRQKYKHFPEHQHGYWEILLNTEGSGSIYIDGIARRFKPGDIAIIPPYTPHRKESAEGFSDISMFVRNFRAIGKTDLKFFADDESQSIRQLMEMAYRYSRLQGSDRFEWSAVNTICALIYQLLVCFYKKCIDKNIKLEGVIEQIYKNISNPYFNLTEVIDQSGYSRSYFRKMFKKETEFSPLAFLNMLRVNHAKELIQQYGHSRSIKDIALACGFTDSLYFSRIFKQKEGVCPSEYFQLLKTKDKAPILFDTPRWYI